MAYALVPVFNLRAEDDHRGLDLDKSASSESSGGYSSDPSYDGEENDTSLKKQNRRAKAKTRSKNKRKRKLVNHEKDKQNDVLILFCAMIHECVL